MGAVSRNIHIFRIQNGRQSGRRKSIKMRTLINEIKSAKGVPLSLMDLIFWCERRESW